MASSAINHGELVSLQELNPSSPHFKQGASLRVTGKLQEYNVDTAIALIVDGNASLKIDTQHLKVNFRVGSLYQFIGEMLFHPNNEVVLKARVGRNVDGMDLNLYHQSLQLLKQFQAEQISAKQLLSVICDPVNGQKIKFHHSFVDSLENDGYIFSEGKCQGKPWL